MRFAHPAAALVVGAFALIAQPRLHVADPSLAIAAPTRSVGRCVRFHQKLADDKSAVELGLRNRCKSRVSCELTWTRRCDGEDGEQRSETVALEVGASSTIRAEVTCDGDWEVADVRWSCTPDG